MMADMVAVVTGLLDWRYAVKQKRTAPNENFIPWAAGVAASLATQTIKMAEDIGRGEISALRTLLDLTSISVQMANQLGHARQQEGTEHYFAFALAKHGVNVSHAEALGPGILFTSALHSQDPSSLRDALLKAGIRLDQLRQADVQLVINDLPTFVRANDLPYGIAHELDPFSDQVQKALQLAGLSGDTGGWKLNPEATPPGGLPPAQ
jgi:glycerol-1-phosphate dehydrogenase [NAD(P)+]